MNKYTTGLLVTSCRHAGRWSLKEPRNETDAKFRTSLKTTYENQYGKVFSKFPKPARCMVDDVNIVQNDDPVCGKGFFYRKINYFAHNFSLNLLEDDREAWN